MPVSQLDVQDPYLDMSSVQDPPLDMSIFRVTSVVETKQARHAKVFSTKSMTKHDRCPHCQTTFQPSWGFHADMTLIKN